MAKFGNESASQLGTCDERLQQLFNEVVKHWDCKILEGKRSASAEARYLAAGESHTTHSKHVYPLGAPSLAVDCSPYPVVWSDTKRFYAFGGFVCGTAIQMGIRIRWGGDWDGDFDLGDQTFNDLVHFEVV